MRRDANVNDDDDDDDVDVDVDVNVDDDDDDDDDDDGDDDGDDWQEFEDDDGNAYFWNRLTGESAWERPPPADPPSLEGDFLDDQIHIDEFGVVSTVPLLTN